MLELVPAREHIPNRLTTSTWHAAPSAPDAETIPANLSSQCGFTMYWAFAASLGVRYHALVLHDAEDEDERLSVPVRPLRQIVRAMVSADGDAGLAS